MDVAGVLYRSKFVYEVLDSLKLGVKCDLRYRIAARYIKPGESIVDVCAGPGRLKDLIPQNCTYTAVDASPEFLSGIRKKNVHTVLWDLHQGWTEAIPKADVIVMIISLCQFRDTSAAQLLEAFKRTAKRVVIIEEILRKPKSENSLIQKAVNYLCATDYYIPVASWYSREEFARLMRAHGYQCEEVSGRYSVGSYGFDRREIK